MSRATSSTPPYTMSDAAKGQRTVAAQRAVEKRAFNKAVDNMLPKFKFHLDERQRIKELAYCITETFTFQQIKDLYEDEVQEWFNHHAEVLVKDRDSLAVDCTRLRDDLLRLKVVSEKWATAATEVDALRQKKDELMAENGRLTEELQAHKQVLEKIKARQNKGVVG